MNSSTSPVDIRPDHIETVREILRAHLPDEFKVWVFGSRANWTTKDSSDLDLAVEGPASLDHKAMVELEVAFEESNLPFTVDVVDLNAVSHSFKQIVKEQRVPLLLDGDGPKQKVRLAGSASGGSPSATATLTVTSGKWREVTLAEAPIAIIDGDRGKSYPKQHELSESGYCLFLNAGNVTSDGFNFSSCAFISSDGDQRLRKGKLDRHDVVLTTRGTVGNSAYFDVTIPYEHVRINSGMVILRALQPALHPRYLYLLTQSELFLSQVQALRTGSAQPQLPIRDIERITIPLPPLAEQRAIAHVLGTLDDKIELNRRMNETLEEMARALFKSWFVDFDPVRAKMEGRDTGLPPDVAALFPDRLVDSELGPIPEGWEVRELGNVIEIHDSKRVPLNSRQRAKRQGPYPYYGAAGIMDYVDDFLFDGVYVLTGEDGSVMDTDGRPVVQYIWGQFWVNNHAHVLRGRNGTSNEHLYLLLQQANITAFVTGAVQPKLSQRNLKAFPIVFPGRSICTAFSGLVGPLFERVRDNADATELLAAQRDALLPKLVSGEVQM